MGRFPQAKKHLGQNFLHSPSMLEKLGNSLSKTGTDESFLEIGPGTGAITTLINKFAKSMLLVEVDSDMLAILDDMPELNSVYKLNLSFLDLTEEAILKVFSSNYHVVGNLPYYITTPCIEHLLLNLKHWDYAYFMVQKEVAQRILAKPGNKTYGRLTVFCSLFAETSLVTHVPRGCFQPVPGVDSSFIRLRRNLRVEESLSVATLKLVKLGFGQRRKQLSGLLSRYDRSLDWKRGFQEIGVSDRVRAEDLSIEKWISLASWSMKLT